MKILDNSGKQIGRISQSYSKDESVTVHEQRSVTTIVTRDLNTGKTRTEILVGQSPFGKGE